MSLPCAGCVSLTILSNFSCVRASHGVWSLQPEAARPRLPHTFRCVSFAIDFFLLRVQLYTLYSETDAVCCCARQKAVRKFVLVPCGFLRVCLGFHMNVNACIIASMCQLITFNLFCFNLFFYKTVVTCWKCCTYATWCREADCSHLS